MIAAVTEVGAGLASPLLAMQTEDAVGLVLAAIVVVYLVVVLVAPERL